MDVTNIQLKSIAGIWILRSLIIIHATEQHSDYNECWDYLVSGPRGVPDGQLSASSSHVNTIHHLHDPKYGRLYFEKNISSVMAASWSAENNSRKEYIQVTFRRFKLIRAVALQGRGTMDQWVTSYIINYSIDGKQWQTVQNSDKTTKIFGGNSDRTTVVVNMLPEQLTVKYLRIHPETWNFHVSLRFDVIGCSKLDQETLIWKKNTIFLSPKAQKDLGQLFQLSTSEIIDCALKCQYYERCLSFLLDQGTSTCTGFQEQLYQGDILNSSLYYLNLRRLSNYEYELIEEKRICYKVITWKTTASLALKICNAENTRLLVIRNQDDLKLVQDDIRKNLILSQQTHFFVDGSLGNDGWTYATGKIIPNSLWSPNHPNTNKGLCTTVTLGGLETYNCAEKLYFICGI